MEDSKKGSYYFPDMTEQEMELEIIREVSTAAAHVERAIWRELNLQDDISILDFGCGPGFISSELATFYPAAQVTGVDVSHELIEYANKQKHRNGLNNLSFRQHDIYDPSLGKNCFDLVYSRFVFQHLTSPGEALTNARKLLKSEGTICIVDIDDERTEFRPCNGIYRSFNRRIASAQAAIGGDRHVGPKLAHYLKKAGFREIRESIRTVTSSELGIKSFIDITMKFKLPVVPDEQLEAAERELNLIRSAANIPGARGSIDIFVVTGKK